jgi:hypothetical protein
MLLLSNQEKLTTEEINTLLEIYCKENTLDSQYRYINDLIDFEFDNTFLKLLFMIMINQKMRMVDINNNFTKLYKKIISTLPLFDIQIAKQLLSCFIMIDVNFNSLIYSIMLNDFYIVIFNYPNLDIKIIQQILQHLIMIFDDKKIDDMKVYSYIYNLYIKFFNIFFNYINNLYENIEEYQETFENNLVAVLEDIIDYLKNKHPKILILTLNKILNESVNFYNINIIIKPYLEEQIKKFTTEGYYIFKL